jgi:uncharacterized protein (TIGR00251 family)
MIKFLETAIELRLWIKPNTQKIGFQGIHEQRLIVGTKAKAKEGEANQALLEFLANYFKIPKSHIKLISGTQSRYKCIHIPLNPKSQEICEHLQKSLEKIIGELE